MIQIIDGGYFYYDQWILNRSYMQDVHVGSKMYIRIYYIILYVTTGKGYKG